MLESTKTLNGTRYVNAVAFSPNGKLVASVANDKTARLWDTDTGKLLQVLRRHLDEVTSVAFSPDGNLVATASQAEGLVYLWDTVPAQLYREEVIRTDAHKNRDDQNNDDEEEDEDIGAGPGTVLYKLTQAGINSLAFSPDGKWLTGASDFKNLRIWDAATGEMAGERKMGSDCKVLSFSNDGLSLHTTMGQIGLWSVLPSHLVDPRSKRDEIFVDGNWVTHGAKKVLLLSHDYRAVQATSQNGVLILTHATGRVSVIELDAAELSREAQEKMEAIDTSKSGNDVS